MAVKLNLLPPEYSVSSTLTKFLGLVRMLGVIALAAFIIFGVGIAGFFIFSTIELNNLKTENDSLKSQIQAQSQTENQIVLLKDRVGKIKTALSQTSSIKDLANVNPLISNFGPNSSVSELSIEPSKTGLTVSFKSNTDLSAFISNVSGTNTFKAVTMSSFGYSPGSGYLVTVNILPK